MSCAVERLEAAEPDGPMGNVIDEPIVPTEADNELVWAFYLGAHTAESAELLVEPGEFRLYHQRPMNRTILTEMPLTLVYRSALLQSFHFPVVRRGSMWRILYGESVTCEYASLAKLVEEKSVYAYIDIAEPHRPVESFRVHRRPKSYQNVKAAGTTSSATTSTTMTNKEGHQ
ncbi:unnamed protein product, partial [Mesorhabditis spiculigera]